MTARGRASAALAAAVVALAGASASMPAPAEAQRGTRQAQRAPRQAPRQGAFSCVAVRPRAVTLRRAVGSTAGTLRWRVPRSAATRVRGRRAQRYRVSRGGRIVGQTARRALRVRVSPGATHRFAVTALNRARRATRCAAVVRVRVRYRLPGAPRFPAVSGDERALQISWQPGARGDGRPAGYRLLRDGRVVGQTTATRWSLPGEPNRSYRFAVVAVDAAGRTSAPSATVSAVTGHAPPTPPGDLQALAVSDVALGVTWSPSSVAVGSVVAYRIMRDGVVVRQLSERSALLDNLAPSTAYGISVVAVDSLGYASEPAGTVASTRAPEPTTGHAHAYLLASTDASFDDFRARYRQIGVVHPTYFDCTGAAEIVGSEYPLVTRWAQARAVEVLPRVNCQRTAVVSRILNDPATRAAWLDRLAGLAAEHGYDGISLDFEAGPAADRAVLTTFVDELAARLHAGGRKLAVAVSPKVRDVPRHPRSGIFDYAALSQSADYLFLMAWGLHWTTSPPGPQDDIRWVRQIVDYVATMPRKDVFVFGTNLYALDWPDGGGAAHRADAFEYQDVVPLLPGRGARIRLDPETDNYQALYTDAAGVAREVWYPDAETTGRRIRIAAAAGLGGVGFWRLGREDQRLWQDPLLAPQAPW